jgi:hypothetical protein
MNINSISIPHIESILERIAKKLKGKPSKHSPILALRSRLKGLYWSMGTGTPLVYYKGGDYEE